MLPKQDPIHVSKLPRSVRRRCREHRQWYLERNIEDGPPAPPAPWTAAGVAKRWAEVNLALGIVGGLQRGNLSMEALQTRLAAERNRAAELQLRADAGHGLARCLNQSRVTAASALLLCEPEFSQAETAPIPTQRVSA